MLFRNLPKIIMVLLGLAFALIGAINLWIAFIGDFQQGRTEVVIAGASLLFISLPFLAFFFSRRISKILGAIVLLALSGSMVWFVFQPNIPATNPQLYQIGAIALAVLVLARIGLGLRPKRSEPGT